MNDFNSFELSNLASRTFIIDSATEEEQLGFILDQIENPFDSGNVNFFKKLRKMVTDKNKMDDYCRTILEKIENVYPHIEFSLDDYDSHLAYFTESVYKFFIKNIRKLTTVYFREFIFNNKNRKGLIGEFQNLRIPNYPKDQYGKKDNYILITKLDSILKSIMELDMNMTDFISYLHKIDDVPLFIDFIEKFINDGLILDYGVYDDIMTKFDESDAHGRTVNKLEIAITKSIIIPYLQEIGMDDIRFGVIDPDEEDDMSDGDDDEEDD